MTTASPPSSVAIIIIGAEVLSAKVQDANGPYLLKELRAHGMQVVELRVIGDDIDTISSTVKALSDRVDYLFTTGGIGPTHDDVTIAAVALAFNKKVIEHPVLAQKLQEHFGSRVDERIKNLARVPEDTHVEMVREKLPLLRCNNVFILPGIPSLVEMCFEHLRPSLPRSQFITRKVMAQVAESEIATHLERIQLQVDAQIQIGSYPKKNQSGWYVEITVDGYEEEAVNETVEKIREGLREDWVLDVQ